MRCRFRGLTQQADQAADNATAQALNAKATNLTVASSKLDGQIEQLDQTERSR